MKGGKCCIFLCLQRRRLVVLSVVALGFTSPVFAALGGDAASVQADQSHFQASLRSVRSNSFQVQELRSPTGVVVREYVSPQGRVFGVAWEGPWMLDMRQLLGSYFEQYQQALPSSSTSRMGRKPLRIDLPGLAVHLAGHPRSYTGQAYLPDTMPTGTTAEDVR
jgi:hypothetical protein